MFNKSFKNLLLAMIANNKYSARDLSSKSNPYEYYLPFRDLSLSLILDKQHIYDEFSKDISYLNKTLDDYIKYNSDYRYLQSVEKSIDGFIPTEVVKKYPEKCYFFKTAILIRLYEGLNRITKGSSLTSFKVN